MVLGGELGPNSVRITLKKVCDPLCEKNSSGLCDHKDRVW